MLYSKTNNQIKYHDYATGPQGMRYTLFPVGDRNTMSQIAEAKEQLQREQDVVKIYVEWIERDEWEKMKLFFHPNAEINNHLNKEYHERFDRIYGSEHTQPVR